MLPLIFGGKFAAELDLCCAVCVGKLLAENDTPADNAVTHKMSIEFHKPSYMGDLIEMVSEVVETRHKAVVVKIRAYRTPRRAKKPTAQLVATGEFVFVTRKGDEYCNHNLDLEKIRAENS